MKIADFGLSAMVYVGKDGYSDGESSRRKLYVGLHEPWGTNEYKAPEILNGAYGPQADVWAVGCMLYEMLSGLPAFARRIGERNFDKLNSRIRKGEINLECGGWWLISKAAKELTAGLIQADPLQRLTATAALNHPWVKAHCSEEYVGE